MSNGWIRLALITLKRFMKIYDMVIIIAARILASQ